MDAEEVARVAHLARLEVDPTVVGPLAEELAGILRLVERMDAVDTTGIEPMAHPLDAMQRLRPDEVTEPDRREELQRGAPAVERGLYLVPRVVE